MSWFSRSTIFVKDNPYSVPNEVAEELQIVRSRCGMMKCDIEAYKREINELKKEIAMLKPIIETSGFRPAVSDKCDQCKYAYFSDYDTSVVIGCCKGMVCEDFESSVREGLNEVAL